MSKPADHRSRMLDRAASGPEVPREEFIPRRVVSTLIGFPESGDAPQPPDARPNGAHQGKPLAACRIASLFKSTGCEN
jgi:hypothetical protein